MSSGILRFQLFVICGLIGIMLGCGDKSKPSETANGNGKTSDLVYEKPDLLQQAVESFAREDFDFAQSTLTKLLIEQPNHERGRFLQARLEAKRGRHADALSLAQAIKTKDRAFVVDLAEFCLQESDALNDDVAIEVSLRQLIAVAADKKSVADRLWKFYHKRGRVFEAAAVADMLCRSGIASVEQLASLSYRDLGFPRELRNGETPEQKFLSGLGVARWHFSQGNLDQARQQLETDFRSGKLPPYSRAFFGRVLAESQSSDDFTAWLQSCTPSEQQYEDYWAALGAYFIHERDYPAATGCLLQTIRLNSMQPMHYRRLAQAMEGLGKTDAAEAALKRSRKIQGIHNILAKSDLTKDLAAVGTAMARMQMEVVRPFEALHWSQFAVPASETQQHRVIAQKRMELNRVTEMDAMMLEASQVGLDPKAFKFKQSVAKLANASKVNDLAGRPQFAASLDSVRDEISIQVRNVAAEKGIDFQWYHALEPNPDELAFFETLGGGIGVIDLDLDGWPDIYLGQGCSDPENADGQLVESNQFYRNLDGSFRQITTASATMETAYTHGIAVGDMNQDGFPDLSIGNIGANRLLVNCGDGTFRDATELIQSNDTFFTSSVAIADVTGDHLPDLFEVNYIANEGAFSEKEQGPLSFNAQPDRWFRNQGDGNFSVQMISTDNVAGGTGLGIMISDLDRKSGNEIFVGNDARANHLLVQTKDGFRNVAAVQGVANGFYGAAVACMGIAAGDFNRDGFLDMHVTNFWDEYDNLYLQSQSGVYRDMVAGFQMHNTSSSYLGFGTKAIDIDRDGWLDLLVTTGHISDERSKGIPFRMPPVVLRNDRTKFVSQPVTDPSEYWSGNYLGRTVAMADFDRDRKMDFLVMHLDQPVALLANETKSPGHFVQFELVGTESERDAIGAIITVKTSVGELSHWVTAGDGYFCSDEAVVDFGIANAESIESVTVTWPSGSTQTFSSIQLDSRYLLIEDSRDAFLR